jgi:hypothetical protein
VDKAHFGKTHVSGPENSIPRELRCAVSGVRIREKDTAKRYQIELLSISVLVWARECMADIQGDLGHGRNAGASTQIDATLAAFLVIVPAAF